MTLKCFLYYMKRYNRIDIQIIFGGNYGKPTRIALLKEIAEFLNEETEIYSMMQGAIQSLIEGSDFTTGWIFFIDDFGHHELVSSVNLPGALSKINVTI